MQINRQKFQSKLEEKINTDTVIQKEKYTIIQITTNNYTTNRTKLNKGKEKKLSKNSVMNEQNEDHLIQHSFLKPSKYIVFQNL